jgi:hypothetical protein
LDVEDDQRKDCRVFSPRTACEGRILQNIGSEIIVQNVVSSCRSSGQGQLPQAQEYSQRGNDIRSLCTASALYGLCERKEPQDCLSTVTISIRNLCALRGRFRIYQLISMVLLTQNPCHIDTVSILHLLATTLTSRSCTR